MAVASACLALAWSAAWPADAPRAFQVKNGAWPWHDRVNSWLMINVPEQLQGGDAVPQQSCSARTIIVPQGAGAVTIGVYDGDAARFLELHPRATDTGLTFGIQNPKGGKSLLYRVLSYADAPAAMDCTQFARAGLVLLKLGATESVARPAEKPKAVAADILQQDQEFEAQEWPFEAGPRKVKMWVQEPSDGINANTGLMLVLHNWGGTYKAERYLSWCKLFADRFNVIAMSVNYLQSGRSWKQRLPYDHGYLQAMDAVRALHTVWRQLKDKGVAFNEHRIYAMGGSGGGNVAQMAMKLAPRTFACGVDICGMPGLTDGIAYGEREYGAGGLNAGYVRDPKDPRYLSKDMQEIRDFGNLVHNRLRHQANPDLKIVIVHGVNDRSCPVVPKIDQFRRMVTAGIDVDGHFITPFHVDGKVIRSTGHAVGSRGQIVIKLAGVYMEENGRLKRARTGPSDFTRGDTFEYPTTNGRFIVDFSGPPTVRFVKKTMK